ncbi:MAG TPA: TIGR04282 family arsenosugar biosynthesis glycosyltransferase, partial [Verrucomicrobiae bacterium]
LGENIREGGFVLSPCLVSRELLIVFVKAPRPGTVKTRIARTAGAEWACAIYREMVETVLQKCASIRGAQLKFAPDDALDEIKPWLRNGWVAAPQGDGDLGERLQRAFAESFAGGAERVVIVGSDCPEVKSADIRAAWKELKSHDVVLGPAVDGGYWLIGLCAPRSELFRGIAWSSDQVLAQTLAQAKSIGLRIQLLRILSDIDTEEDWNAYVSETGSS